MYYSTVQTVSTILQSIGKTPFQDARISLLDRPKPKKICLVYHCRVRTRESRMETADTVVVARGTRHINREVCDSFRVVPTLIHARHLPSRENTE